MAFAHYLENWVISKSKTHFNRSQGGICVVRHFLFIIWVQSCLCIKLNEDFFNILFSYWKCGNWQCTLFNRTFYRIIITLTFFSLINKITYWKFIFSTLQACMGCKDFITTFYITEIEPFLVDTTQYGKFQVRTIAATHKLVCTKLCPTIKHIQSILSCLNK